MSGLSPVTLFAVLAASIAGSVHCVGMCGGLMLAATGSQLQSQLSYHLFRWLGYLFMGSLMAFLGREFLFEWKWLPIQLIFSTLVLGVLLGFALGLVNPRFDFVKRFFTSVFARISQFGIRSGLRLGSDERSLLRAAVVGFFTVFLPCGWLYSFMFLALATHSVFAGIIILTVFWLGTLPALLSSRILIQGVLSKVGVKGTRMISILMVMATLFSFYEHWSHYHSGQHLDGSGKPINCEVNSPASK